MRVHITVQPLLKKLNMTREQFCREIEWNKDLSNFAAQQRLNRIEEKKSKRISMSTLAQILRYARQEGISFEDILRLESRNIFDLLPSDSTYFYIGAYGDTDPNQPHWVEHVTTSVWDHRSARRLSRPITRDFSRLLFSLSSTADPAFINEHVVNRVDESRRRKQSLVSLGSCKTNTTSEKLISDALGLLPFNASSQAASLPFMFHFYVLDNKAIDKLPRSTATFRTAEPEKGSYIVWNNQEFTYEPPEPPRREAGDEVSAAEQEYAEGKDYAVVVLQGLDECQGNLTISGISGTSTFGASALACAQPHRFEVPNNSEFVRVYLVDIRMKLKNGMFRPFRARVIGHWTKHTGAYSEPEQSWCALPMTVG